MEKEKPEIDELNQLTKGSIDLINQISPDGGASVNLALLTVKDVILIRIQEAKLNPDPELIKDIKDLGLFQACISNLETQVEDLFNLLLSNRIHK